jgi:hypothetical protein
MAQDLVEIRRNADRWRAMRAAFDHEHGRLYRALETAAQLAELAGHDDIAAALRTQRHEVHRHLLNGHCL